MEGPQNLCTEMKEIISVNIEDHHDNQTRFHGMLERENNGFTDNRVDIQVISKKTYEAGIPSVEINIDTEENKRKK